VLAELTPDRAARIAWLAATGARWGESERATRSDITGQLVRLRGTKTALARREVPLVLTSQKRLMAFALAHAEGPKAMFRPWGNVRRDLRAACERARVMACSPNDLRRSLAHWLRLEGVPAELVALVLGHSTTKLVHGVYGRLEGDSLGQALRASMVAAESSATASPVHHSQRPDRISRTERTLNGSEKPMEIAGFVVPRDGIEPPTRGFSIPEPRPLTPRQDKRKEAKGEPTAAPVQQRSRRGAA